MTTKLESTYASAHATAIQLVTRVNDIILDMPEPESGINYGHLGDLQEINSKLADIIEFMAR